MNKSKAIAKIQPVSWILTIQQFFQLLSKGIKVTFIKPLGLVGPTIFYQLISYIMIK